MGDGGKGCLRAKTGAGLNRREPVYANLFARDFYPKKNPSQPGDIGSLEVPRV
jgi:hypothetical protein